MVSAIAHSSTGTEESWHILIIVIISRWTIFPAKPLLFRFLRETREIPDYRFQSDTRGRQTALALYWLFERSHLLNEVQPTQFENLLLYTICMMDTVGPVSARFSALNVFLVNESRPFRGGSRALEKQLLTLFGTGFRIMFELRRKKVSLSRRE